jgi:hypothetical protein
MTRVQDWEVRFIELMDALQVRSFDWRNFNCLHRAALVVKALRGDDFDLPVIPELSGKESADQALADLGKETLGDFLLSLFENVAVVMAQRGDLGVSGQSIVICMGTYWSGFTDDGHVRLDRIKVQRAFKV